MITDPRTLHIVGGGLAGSEAAWQAAEQGIRVVLHEMRPDKKSGAHRTGGLAELVCSNSFKSADPTSAPGRLKEELRAFDSLIMKAAAYARVPAGAALAVDRVLFSEFVSKTLSKHPGITIRSGEVCTLPDQDSLQEKNAGLIVATGPLTSEALADALQSLCGGKRRLYFYDAIAPVLAAESLDLKHCFFQDRYGKGDGQGDYLNIPLSKEQYGALVEDIRNAEKVPLHSFEEARYFECCLPIEVMVERGAETLRFGPMKPVGIADPASGIRPWANIQLRMENSDKTMFSMVGFQTKMKWPEQKRIFSKFPALKNAEFLRYGSVHRNTYIRSPEVLGPELEVKASPRIRLAGQITGVEGYLESAATGLLAGRAAAAQIADTSSFTMPPAGTLTGALLRYVTLGCKGHFSPMNANLGLLPPVDRIKGEKKNERKARQCRISAEQFRHYLDRTGCQ